MGSSLFLHTSLELLGLTDYSEVSLTGERNLSMKYAFLLTCHLFFLSSVFLRLIASLYKTADLQKA